MNCNIENSNQTMSRFQADEEDIKHISQSTSNKQTCSTRAKSNGTSLRLGLSCSILLVFVIGDSPLRDNKHDTNIHSTGSNLILSARGHIVLTKDDRSQSLVLTGEDGKGSSGDQLVIAGNNMGGGGNGQDSNMVMQDAANREGDVVINGNSMIIPGEDGHIVLADSRSRHGGGGGQGHRPFVSPIMFWLPYMSGRSVYRMLPYLAGNQFK